MKHAMGSTVRRTAAFAGMCMALGGIMQGCMLSPLNGQSHEGYRPWENIGFNGMSWLSGGRVELRAWNPTTHRVEQFDVVQSETESVGSMYGRSLFPWQASVRIPYPLWEPGMSSQGYSFRARVGARTYGNDHLTFDRDISLSEILACESRNDNFEDFARDCGSSAYPLATITTHEDFVPMPFGDATCVHGSRHCTRCVDGVLERIQRVYQGNEAQRSVRTFESEPDYIDSITNHVQGIARLPDVETGSWDGWQPGQATPISGRLVMTRDRVPGGGLYVMEQVNFVGPEANDPQSWRDGSYGWVVDTIDVQDSGLNHAGGVQALGDTVAVAIECAGEEVCPHSAEIRFYDFGGGFTGTEINRLVLNGSQGEPRQGDASNAASVAVTKLRGGSYLMFVADKTNVGGWFYESTTTHLDNTDWRFLQYWQPDCVGSEDGCWPGANNMTFLNDCNGNIFLVTMDGHAEEVLPDYPESYVGVFQLALRPNGRFDFHRLDYFEPNTYGEWDDGQTNVAYRWGATFSVSPQGKLGSMVTARDAGPNLPGLGGPGLVIQQFVPPDAWD